ncbi:hypothetical protein L1987_87464 [Smallanthus sonchifolius]|nr:hypothetical protein L1987_87464 [Smallanthus sonchifolius]
MAIPRINPTQISKEHLESASTHLNQTLMQKDEVRDKSIQSLTTQMGQLATEVAELKKGKGQLPSDTKANLSPGLVDGVVEDITGNENLVDRCDPHEYEEDVLETCVCDFSEQVQVCALRMEEKKQEALAVREGRPPWTHQIESLPVEINSGTKPSLEEPPTLELKDLPSHLKYVFLGDNDTLPVIIASNLEKAQEQALLKVLKANKEAIGKRDGGG